MLSGLFNVNDRACLKRPLYKFSIMFQCRHGQILLEKPRLQGWHQCVFNIGPIGWNKCDMDLSWLPHHKECIFGASEVCLLVINISQELWTFLQKAHDALHLIHIVFRNTILIFCIRMCIRVTQLCWTLVFHKDPIRNTGSCFQLQKAIRTYGHPRPCCTFQEAHFMKCPRLNGTLRGGPNKRLQCWP
jgi:hypothetical protein